MIGDFQIRTLRSADLADYKRLRDTMLERHEDAFTSSAATESRRSVESYLFRLPQASGNGTLFTLCAWAQGELVGAVSCERDSRTKVAHIATIVGMMVRDDRQGQGIGRTLLAAALQQARADIRLEQLILTVTASNTRAVRLYAQAGFVRYGYLPRAIKLIDDPAAAPVYLDKDLMVCTLR